MGGSDIAGIAAPAAPAAGYQKALAGYDQVRDYFRTPGVVNNRSGRHMNDDVFAIAAGFVCAFAVFASFGAKMPARLKVEQRAHIVIDFEIHTAAPAAIAAIRTAFGHVFLTAKTHTTAATAAGFDKDFGGIDEH